MESIHYAYTGLPTSQDYYLTSLAYYYLTDLSSSHKNSPLKQHAFLILNIISKPLLLISLIFAFFLDTTKYLIDLTLINGIRCIVNVIDKYVATRDKRKTAETLRTITNKFLLAQAAQYQCGPPQTVEERIREQAASDRRSAKASAEFAQVMREAERSIRDAATRSQEETQTLLQHAEKFCTPELLSILEMRGVNQETRQRLQQNMEQRIKQA